MVCTESSIVDKCVCSRVILSCGCLHMVLACFEHQVHRGQYKVLSKWKRSIQLNQSKRVNHFTLHLIEFSLEYVSKYDLMLIRSYSGVVVCDSCFGHWKTRDQNHVGE